MPRVLRRSLFVAATAFCLAGPLPIVTGASPLGGAAQAQEAAPQEAAPQEQAPSKRRRGRGKPAKAITAPGMQQATPLAIFGDWNVFANGQGKSRICYAIAQPQTRSPKTLKRDTAYLFVTVRKAENVQNEVAVMLGFPARPAVSQGKAGTAPAPTDPTITLGAARYGLVVKEGNAWLQNQAEESRVVGEMGRAQRLQVKTTSMRGNPTNDEYAMGGFAEAMKRAREECK